VNDILWPNVDVVGSLVSFSRMVFFVLGMGLGHWLNWK